MASCKACSGGARAQPASASNARTMAMLFFCHLAIVSFRIGMEVEA
jgi:hypothetical protein